MRAVVVYGSRHGCTRKCAQLLAEKLQADSIDLADVPEVEIGNYDMVVVGTPVYAARLNPAVLLFCAKHHSTLLQKRLGLFVCCGFADKAMEQLASGLSRELVDAAVAIGYFGYSFTGLSLLERMIAKMVGAPIGKNDIRDEEIEAFASKMRETV